MLISLPQPFQSPALSRGVGMILQGPLFTLVESSIIQMDRVATVISVLTKVAWLYTDPKPSSMLTRSSKVLGSTFDLKVPT